MRAVIGRAQVRSTAYDHIEMDVRFTRVDSTRHTCTASLFIVIRGTQGKIGCSEASTLATTKRLTAVGTGDWPISRCALATARPAEPNPHGARGGRAWLHCFEATVAVNHKRSQPWAN